MLTERPMPRTDRVVVEAIDGGLVVYDQVTNRAHALNGPAARLWPALDGRRTPAELATALGIDLAVVTSAIDHFAARGLLVERTVSRRRMLQRTAVVGAVALTTAPMIDTVIIPTASAHASTGSGPGTTTTTATPPGPPANTVDYDISYNGGTTVNVAYPPPNRTILTQALDTRKSYTTEGLAIFELTVGSGSSGTVPVAIAHGVGPQAYVVQVLENNTLQAFYVLLGTEATPEISLGPETFIKVGTET